MTVVEVVSSLLCIEDFVSNEVPKEMDEIKPYFEAIERQLNEQKEQTKVVLQAIKQLSLIRGYSESEHGIYGLKTLLRLYDTFDIRRTNTCKRISLIMPPGYIQAFGKIFRQCVGVCCFQSFNAENDHRLRDSKKVIA